MRKQGVYLMELRSILYEAMLEIIEYNHKLKFILSSIRLIVNGLGVQDSVMYIAYISSEERDYEAYESRSKDGDFYWIRLAIRYAKELEGKRLLVFTGETQLITLPRSSIDTTAIIDWTQSKTWTPEYGRELLEQILKTKRFYFINKQRQTDPDKYILIRAVYWRPKYY